MAFWRGVARAERCLIDRQMPIEGDYYGSGILVRERVELAVKARGVGGCRCSSGEFLRGSMCFDRREIIAVEQLILDVGVEDRSLVEARRGGKQ
jgi:hypothetical protein